MSAQWIPTTERSPEHLVDVLVTWSLFSGDEPTVDIAFLRPDGSWLLSGMELTIQPTHWMTLPAPAEPEGPHQAEPEMEYLDIPGFLRRQAD